MSANRVMKSVTSWLERKLYLKVSTTKTKVVRPTNSQFLGFTFWKTKDKWECRPCKDRKKKLCNKIKGILTRKKGSSKIFIRNIQESKSSSKRMDKLFQNRNDEEIP